MSKRIIINSLVSGELSPELWGRHDLKAYFNGAAGLENWIVRRTGGIRKFTGTEVLFTLDASQAPDDGTQDNKFKIIPYYFDTYTWGLLVFRLTTDGATQSKLIIREGDISTVGDWSNVPIPMGITETAEFDDLQYKQVGDTIFFTRLGHQAFKCAITMSERTTEFTLIDNDITVPVPAQITLAKEGFKEVDENNGIFEMEKYYALYGVKDSVLSKPSTANLTGRTPWSLGATITVTGTLDFSIHDYYILAKKTGMNFGKLSEIYPEEQTSGIKATHQSSDVLFRDSEIGFYDNGDKVFNGDPELTALDSSKIKNLTEKAMGLVASDNGGAQRVVTPHYHIDFGAAANTYVSMFLTLSVVQLDTQKAKAINMAGAKFNVYAFEYNYDETGTIAVDAAPTAVTANAKGRITVNLGSRTGDKYIGFIIESADASTKTKMTDCLFSAGTVLYRAGPSYFTCDAVLTVAPDAFSADPEYANTQSVPSVFGKFGSDTDLIYSTLWQKFSVSDSYLNTAAEITNSVNIKLAQRQIDSANNFHIYNSKLSEITFDVPADQQELSSIVLHLGSTSVDWGDGSQVVMEDTAYVTMNLYTLTRDEPAIETLVGTFTVQTGYVEGEKIIISYDKVDPLDRYKITFSAPVRMRGITASAINNQLHFVDDNIIPGEVTGQQDMLTVGDNNMDCAVFDIFEQRSVFAASEKLPFTLWFGRIAELYNFYAFRPQADDDAFEVTIPAKRASKIRHLLAARDLKALTEDGVYLIDSEGGNGFSFRTVRMRKICNEAASADCPPIDIDGKTLFVGEDRRTLSELKYDLMSDSIVPNNMSIKAYHLTETAQMAQMAYQRYPDSVVWVLLNDGNLLALTYMPEHEVAGWSHVTVPATAANLKAVEIFDIGSVVSGDGIDTTSDIVLVMESHDENGDRDSVTLIERMRPPICTDVLPIGDDRARCIFHLGGASEEDVIASAITLRPELQDFNSQGIPKNILDCSLRLRRSGAVSVKPYTTGLDAITKDLSSTDAAAGTLTLFNGDMKIMPKGYINQDGQMVISSPDSSPCEITSIVFIVGMP